MRYRSCMKWRSTSVRTSSRYVCDADLTYCQHIMCCICFAAKVKGCKSQKFSSRKCV